MLYTAKLIDEPYAKYKLTKYLEERLDRAGIANVDIQRTPMVTRITLEVMNPARVIGRKGKIISDLTDEIKRDFKIDNPQISVIEVKNPSLEPRLVAKRIGNDIMLGRKKMRAILHRVLADALSAGALGAEFEAAGKVGQKGSRTKTLRLIGGHIPKAGDQTRLVKEAHLSVNTKSGVIGILVRIVPPGTVFPEGKKKWKKDQGIKDVKDLDAPKEGEPVISKDDLVKPVAVKKGDADEQET